MSRVRAIRTGRHATFGISRSLGRQLDKAVDFLDRTKKPPDRATKAKRFRRGDFAWWYSKNQKAHFLVLVAFRNVAQAWTVLTHRSLLHEVPKLFLVPINGYPKEDQQERLRYVYWRKFKLLKNRMERAG